MKKNRVYIISLCTVCFFMVVLAGVIGIVKPGGTITAVIFTALFALITGVIIFLLITRILKQMSWYESMLDSIPFPISVTDMDMNWTFINKPVEEMLNVKRSDMVGKHCSNWGAAICKTENCGINCLRKNKQITFFNQFDMDFQVNINYLYDDKKNKIGHIEVVQDISKTIKIQNEQSQLIDNIRKISGSFLTSSSYVSSSSQSLAQGSMEQAATIEQLSAVINEVSQKTKENADMATKAAKLADSIKLNAEKGSNQMDNMMNAVKEISDASSSIKDVIRVIDDIAFQTNILALNAAVEAARAGQQGKGFAVVADEVRSLAAKSAEAAKNTENLIANSIEKSEIGVKIAKETAASLSEIVEGINESNRIVSDIAKSSEEQTSTIKQINHGIDQISNVIQQNSASAQESAAASIEMSKQSGVLDNMVNEFKNN